MEVQFCRNNDGNVAVGVGRWEGRKVKNPYPPRPNDLCRACYVDTYGGEFVKVKVSGAPFASQFAIACARTGQDVETGGVAELDPAATNLAPLVAGGLIEIVKDEPAAAGKKASGDKA